MVQSLPYLHESASQTGGPYVHIGLPPGAEGFRTFDTELGQTLAPEAVPCPRITIELYVSDGPGAPVKDVLIKAGQADAKGISLQPEAPCAAECAPGFRGCGRAIPDLDFGLFRSEAIGLHTRMYRPEDTAAHAADPPARRLDIRQQGEGETSFTDL